MAGDSPIAENYRALARLMSAIEREFGAAPADVEAKAALETRLAAEAVTLDGGPVSWAESEAHWTKGKMETPGVQEWEYTYVLKLEVTAARREEVLAQVRAYWLRRGLAIRHWEPVSGVSASPGKGEWALASGVLDESSMYVRVESGSVQTSSSPLRSEEDS